MRLIVIFLLFGCQIALGQIEVVKVERPLIQGPEYLGGPSAMFEKIKYHLRYPPQAIKDKVSGVVKLGFIVDTAGRVKNVEVIKSVRKDLDDEAIRLVKMLNEWSPAYQNGDKAEAKMTIPIRFTN
jgi:protein TonB